MTRGRIDKYVFYILKRCTLFRSIHHLDIILLAILAVERRDRTVDTVTQVSGGSLEVQSVERELFTVKVHLILRLIVGTRHSHVGSTLDARQKPYKTLCHGVGLGKVITIDLVVKLRLTAHTHTAAHGHLHLAELGVMQQVVTHHRRNLGDAAFTVARVKKAYVGGNNVGTVVAQRSESVVTRSGACGIVHHHNLRVFLLPLGIEPFHGILGNFDTGADRKLQVDRKACIVSHGEELSAHIFHQEYGADKSSKTYHDSHGLVTDYFSEQPRITVVKCVKSLAYGSIKQIVNLSMLHILAEQLRAEHRGK